ncbi:hypothetical protein WJX77_006068 [Trebouxia sp. C0004]
MTQIAKRGPGHVVSVTTVESPLSSPITLELHMCWNRLYRTLATPGPEELVVTGANQVPKETGSGHDTWLTYAGLSQDFGNDCLVQVCRLYPTLDGVRQVDKLKAQDQQLAIRAPVYGDMHQQEISNAIAQSRPTIQKVRQASQSKILHELTVNRYSVKDNLGNDILQTALEEKLQSAGACAASAASTALHPISTLPPHCQRQHPGPTVQALQDIQILPSTIVGISPTHQRPSSDSGLSTASESSTQSVWTRLGELAEYMTIKNRHFEKHLLKVESHVEDHDADILELNLNNLDLDKRWSHSGKEARSPSPGEEMLSCVRDPEDMDEGMPDYSPSQEAVLSPLDTCPAAHAAPERGDSAVLTFPPHDDDLLQQAVIKALRLHPHSNALALSYSLWPQHPDVQHDRACRSAMKVMVSSALYRLPPKVAGFRKQRDSQKLWALAADMPDKS